VQYVLKYYEEIRKEVGDYIHRRFDIDYVNPAAPQMSTPETWKNIYFKNYLLKYKIGKKHFPKTYQLLIDNPDITLAGITTLAPGGKLMSHCGETNAIIRCHLGLKVPGKLPELGLSVKGKSVCWEEGKVFAFNDAYQHEAWNNTSEYRYVLVFDIMRPEFSKYKIVICAYCLGIAIMRIMFEKMGIYEKSPLWLRSLVAKPIALPIWFYLKAHEIYDSITGTKNN
jgi:ornithine lipid ester-linked acyl 2-hydroxylase